MKASSVASLVIALAMSLAAIHVGCRQAEPGPPAPRPSPAREPAAVPVDPAAGHLQVTVKRVIDGDTLLVSGLATGTGLVRLTGVNAPETGEGRTTRECFGLEARRWLTGEAPPGTRLSLVLDVGPRDRFGRLLAYAYRADGTFLNAGLLAGGYAQTMTIRPNVRHAEEFRALQRQARSQKRGLWGACPPVDRNPGST